MTSTLEQTNLKSILPNIQDEFDIQDLVDNFMDLEFEFKGKPQ